MSIYETSHQNSSSIERRNATFRRVTSAVASTALFSALITGCSPENKPVERSELPERNAPSSSAPYSMTTNEVYFQDVAAMKDFTDNPEVLEHLDALLEVPVAEWLYDNSKKTEDKLVASLSSSEKADAIPLFVAYNIPGRDLGGYSTGGTETDGEYKDWLGMISYNIADRPAVIVMEPDALPHIPELDEAAANERIELLAAALDTFKDNANTAVYLDAGNSSWLEAGDVAELLKRVSEKTENGLTGISLNVANFISDEETEAYGEAIQQAYGQDLYVMIDSSRNGAPDAVPEGEWCNPEGQRLGTIDPNFTSDAPVEHAFIKTPGQSDGECGIGSKPAGEFDGELLFHQLGD